MSASHKGHGRRLAKLRAICAGLRNTPMVASEICVLIKLSKDGARPYIMELRAAGLLIEKPCGGLKNGATAITYSVTCDQANIDAYLDKIALLARSGYELKKPGSGIHKSKKISRAVHLMKDDTTFYPKVPSGKSPPRHWLDVALFGSGPARRALVEAEA